MAKKRSDPGPAVDYLVIGSGFGGSVSALRLAEKGYSVLVLERGKRYRDQDFAKTNWIVWKYLWAPALRCFGILQISPFRDVFVLHGSGVGGGSLGYSSILMEPDESTFDVPAWKQPVNWKTVLREHYDTARRMLGIAPNPHLGPADAVLQEIAQELGTAETFRPTEGGFFFGEPGVEVPDPYFGGEGPARMGCTFCGECLVGCRHNAKNHLGKNYLYLAEKWGAELWPESEVHDIRPLPTGQPDGARYEVAYHRSTAWFFKRERTVRARNVILAAGALGTLRLLFRCRDLTRSLPQISPCLGNQVRTNSESFLGASSFNFETDYSQGISITSVLHADPVTTIEPVRYPAGSDLMRYLSGPLIEGQDPNSLVRFLRVVFLMLSHPHAFFQTHIFPGWSKRTTILLVMQNEDNRLRLRFGRSLFTLFRKNLVSKPDEEVNIPSKIDIGHQVARRFAEKINGHAAGTINESLLNIPMTAHILGGCPFGKDADEGVIDLDCQVHNYPGLYVIDGSIIPANPGVNPALTITAMAEYAMSCVPAHEKAQSHPLEIAMPSTADA